MTLRSNQPRKRKSQDQMENNIQQLQIQTEFQILQSLIPGISEQNDITEVNDFISPAR